MTPTRILGNNDEGLCWSLLGWEFGVETQVGG